MNIIPAMTHALLHQGLRDDGKRTTAGKWTTTAADGEHFVQAVKQAQMKLEKQDYAFFGFQIVETECIVKEVQARTHRKKRINKKWRKRYGMKTVPDLNRTVLFQKENGGHVLYAHPKTVARLREAIGIGEHSAYCEKLRSMKGELWDL